MEKDYLGVEVEYGDDWDAFAEALANLQVVADVSAVEIAVALRPFAEWWVNAQPMFDEFIAEMSEIVGKLEDEKELARKQSRDDLARKRRSMRGRGRHILPPR